MRVTTVSAGILMSMLVPTSAFAMEGTTGKVDMVHVTKTEIYITLEGKPNLCPLESPAPSNPRLAITNGHTDAAMARVLSLLTAAKLSGKAVTVYTEGASTWACFLKEVRML